MGKSVSMLDLETIRKQKKAISFGNPSVRPHKALRQYLHQIMPPGAWEGNSCFIVAGGASLKGFDFSRLEGELVIAVNRAIEYVPNAKMMVAQDSRLWGWYESGDLGEQARKKFKDFKGVKVWVNTQEFPYPEDFYIVNVNKELTELNKDYSAGLPFCTNSGLNALLLAVCLGANPIYLLGFDGEGDNFHSGYPEPRNNDIYKDVFIPDFDHFAPQINYFAEVINLNPQSKIRCFETGVIENVPKKKIIVEGYAGLGDNFFQRPFIKELSKSKDVYLKTYHPQIYWDIPGIKFLKYEHEKFVSHKKNADRLDVWSPIPDKAETTGLPYYWNGFRLGMTIKEQYQEVMPVRNYDFSFPVKQEWVDRAKDIIASFDTGGKKICLVKFPSRRKEWSAIAREPKPEYLQMLIDRYKDEYFFISLADLRGGNEEFYVAPRNIDKEFHYGELTVEDIFGLIKISDMVICGSCFLFPAGVAVGTKTFVIGGGTQDPSWFVDEKEHADVLRIVKPMPFCRCNNPRHESCNKEIPEERITGEFENFKAGKKKVLNLLLCRLSPRYLKLFYDKELLEKYNISALESVNNMEHYDDAPFKVFYFEREDCKKLLISLNPDIVIISQKLFPVSDKIASLCKELGIQVLWTEAFFDGRLKFDYWGLDYTPTNEIRGFIDSIPLSDEPIRLPFQTRESQPDMISRDDLFAKYGLNPEDKHIVILGQTIFDMSLKHSKNPEANTYRDYIDLILNNNPDVKFLFKPHPHYFGVYKDRYDSDMGFLKQYSNLIVINENIKSLFQIFDRFSAFSSTTIFEGLIQDKKFATMGYHYCAEDSLVLQIRKNSDALNLYDKLGNFEINQSIK